MLYFSYREGGLFAMDTKFFEYVLEIADCGSINKATKRLHISQPNLSVSIKNLEAELGFQLFERGNKGIRLTREGELFVLSARTIVREVNSVRNIPQFFDNKNNLSISCTNSFDFMNCFMRFKKKHPPTGYEDSIKETGLIQTVRDVYEFRYRMSLFYCFDSLSERYRNFAKEHGMRIVTIALRKRLILLVSKKHPLAQKKEVAFQDVKNYKFVMYENYEFNEWLGLLGFENDNHVLTVFDRGGLLDAIKQNMYVTVMMEHFTDLYSGDCVEIPLTGSDQALNVFLLYYKSYKLNAREQLFIKTLRELFREPRS